MRWASEAIFFTVAKGKTGVGPRIERQGPFHQVPLGRHDRNHTPSHHFKLTIFSALPFAAVTKILRRARFVEKAQQCTSRWESSLPNPSTNMLYPVRGFSEDWNLKCVDGLTSGWYVGYEVLLEMTIVVLRPRSP